MAFVEKALDKGKEVLSKTKESVTNVSNQVISRLDLNGDGEVGIDDIISAAIRVKGVHVDRAAFLRKELFKNHPEEIIAKAIDSTPALAGISPEEIDKIALEVIKFERRCVSGISAALGAPGGWAMVATIPADIVQYYAYTLRAVQKLLYLYGFPEIKTGQDGLFIDTETTNTIILCLGVMNRVAGANNAIKGMAKALAKGVEKKLLNTALTKGAFYPIVKNVLKWFGINLTKAAFAGFFRKAIPVVGGVVGGGITYAAFKPCCIRLQNVLQDTLLSNASHVSSVEEELIYDDVIAQTKETTSEN